VPDAHLGLLRAIARRRLQALTAHRERGESDRARLKVLERLARRARTQLEDAQGRRRGRAGA
jgi:hypothetical protein